VRKSYALNDTPLTLCGKDADGAAVHITLAAEVDIKCAAFHPDGTSP
jgi:hypothetical protein